LACALLAQKFAAKKIEVITLNRNMLMKISNDSLFVNSNEITLKYCYTTNTLSGKSQKQT
jgi:hypothetical protein